MSKIVSRLSGAGNNDAKVSVLDAEFTSRRQSMNEYYQLWLMCWNFYRGKQWIYWNDAFGLKELRSTKNLTLYTSNHILPIIEGISRAMAERPQQFIFLPADRGYDDVKVSMICEDLDRYHQHKLRLEEINMLTASYMCLFGTTFRVNYWDGTSGDRAIIDNPVKNNPDGTPEAVEIITGMVGEKHLPPWELLPNPEATLQAHTFVDCILHGRYPLRYYKDNYKNGHLVQADKNTVNGALSTNPVSNLMSKNDNSAHDDWAILKEYREIPSKDFPLGRWIQWAGGQILSERDSDFHDGRMGIEVFRYYNLPGSFWGMGVAEHLIPLQMEYNRCRTQIINHREIVIRGRWQAPKGAHVDMTNAPGSVVTYNVVPGVRRHIEPLATPSLGREVYDSLEMSQREMMDVASYHEASRGMKDSSVESGVAMAYKAEQDASGRMGAIRRFQLANGRCVANRIALEHFKRQDDLRFPVIGDGNQVQWRKFLANGQPVNVDVYVAHDTSVPISKVAAREMYRRDYTDGVFGDPESQEARTTYMKLMNMSRVDASYQEVLRAENQQDEEIEVITERNEKAEVGEWQLHTVHMLRLDSFRNSPDWNALDPETKQEINAHYDEHVKLAPETLMGHIEQVQQQMEQMQQQMQQTQQQAQEAVEAAQKEAKQAIVDVQVEAAKLVAEAEAEKKQEIAVIKRESDKQIEAAYDQGQQAVTEQLTKEITQYPDQFLTQEEKDELELEADLKGTG